MLVEAIEMKDEAQHYCSTTLDYKKAPNLYDDDDSETTPRGTPTRYINNKKNKKKLILFALNAHSVQNYS